MFFLILRRSLKKKDAPWNSHMFSRGFRLAVPDFHQTNRGQIHKKTHHPKNRARLPPLPSFLAAGLSCWCQAVTDIYRICWCRRRWWRCRSRSIGASQRWNANESFGVLRPFSCVLLLLDEEFFFGMSLNHRFHRCSKYFPHQVFLSQKKPTALKNMTNPTPRICKVLHTHRLLPPGWKIRPLVTSKLSLEELRLDWELPLWELIQVELLPERKWSLFDLSTRCHKGIRKLTTK